MKKIINPDKYAKDIISGFSNSSKYVPSMYFFPDYINYLANSYTNGLFENNKNLFETKNEEIDLVFIAPNKNLPVCKIKEDLLASKNQLKVNSYIFSPFEKSGSIEDESIDNCVIGIEAFDEINIPDNKLDNIIIIPDHVVSFLPFDQLMELFARIKKKLSINDKLIIFFPLKNNPNTIQYNYLDNKNIEAFRLNILCKLNKDFEGDLDFSKFDFYTTYLPDKGTLQLFLVSKLPQKIKFKLLNFDFSLGAWEPIFIGRLQRYGLKSIEMLASTNGFQIENNFYSENNSKAISSWKLNI